MADHDVFILYKFRAVFSVLYDTHGPICSVLYVHVCDSTCDSNVWRFCVFYDTFYFQHLYITLKTEAECKKPHTFQHQTYFKSFFYHLNSF